MLKNAIAGSMMLWVTTVAFGAAPKAGQTEQVSLVVTASAPTEAAGIKKAVALAAERAFGVYVLDRTSFDKNGQVINSFAEMAANGIVKSYKVLQSVRDENGDQVVTIEATVDPVKLEQNAQSGQHETWKDALSQLALISTEQQRLRKVNDMLNTLTGPTPQDFFNRAYNVDFVRYEIKEILPNSVSLDAIVRISLNSVFWKTYMSVVSAGASAVGTKFREGMFEDSDGFVIGVANTAQASPWMAESLVKPLAVTVTIAGQSIKFAVWKNGFFSFMPTNANCENEQFVNRNPTNEIWLPRAFPCSEYRSNFYYAFAKHRPKSLFKSADKWFPEPYAANGLPIADPSRYLSVLGNSVTVAVPIVANNEQAVATLPRNVTTDIDTSKNHGLWAHPFIIPWKSIFKNVHTQNVAGN